ncbi:hypothetical protein DPMN_119527 [Dreissena polymorpha]|uniref:C-type lectin domain-containing protein n=1 Tax=Dreissena polymorpha TaxID=45954 RepID=A0A9D4JS10_DREPO|nr:hypothetical protein DPMN_119527 [Dreissena polymorpha]
MDRVVQTRMNFTAAQDNCAADGATLARITTVPKMQLFQYILRSWGGNPELSDHWISGLPQGGQWVTELNEVIPPTRDFWLPQILSAYSNQEPELRVVMFYMSFFFNRLHYSEGLFSICEKL